MNIIRSVLTADLYLSRYLLYIPKLGSLVSKKYITTKII